MIEMILRRTGPVLLPRRLYNSKRTTPQCCSFSSSSATSSDEEEQNLKHQQQQFMLLNSLSLTDEPLPLKERPLVCFGPSLDITPTVNLKHARSYVGWDILRRLVEGQRPTAQPIFVLPINDIYIKTPKKPIEPQKKKKKQDPLLAARRYERDFWRDWDVLQLLRPHVVTRISDHVEPTIIPFLQNLLDHGLAYVKGSTVYFDTPKFDHLRNHSYGRLALAQSRALRRVFESRDARDFVLWEEINTSTTLSWKAPWFEGVPSLPLAFAAMRQSVIDQLLVQDRREQHQKQAVEPYILCCGEFDTKFPNNTNEMAVTEAYTPPSDNSKNNKTIGQLTTTPPSFAPTIHHWLHNGVLHQGNLHYYVKTPDGSDHTKLSTLFKRKNKQESMANYIRWWCLTENYQEHISYDPNLTIQEMRLPLHQIVLFLTKGQARVQQQSNRPTPPSGVWTEEDHAFFQAVKKSKEEIEAKLLNDLDARCAEEILYLIEDGQIYLQRTEYDKNNNNNNDDDRATTMTTLGPLQFALHEVRSILQQLGFTSAIWAAGLPHIVSSKSGRSGGVEVERVLDTLARFRATVYEELRRGGGDDDDDSPNVVKLLQLCEKLRDKTLPAMGVNLLDKDPSATDDEEDDDDDEEHGEQDEDADDDDEKKKNKKNKEEEESPSASSLWQYRTPAAPPTPLPKKMPKEQLLPSNLMFSEGADKDQYSSFDYRGLPLTMYDGTPVAKDQREKFLKQQLGREKMLRLRDKALRKRAQRQAVDRKSSSGRNQLLQRGPGMWV